MKTIAFVVLCIFAGMACGGCESVPSGTYHSKLGNFTCTVPQLIRPGAKMQEKSTPDYVYVSFTDDVGTLLRIECFHINPEDKETLSRQDAGEMLRKIFDNEAMPKEFLAISRLTSVLDEETVDTTAGKAFFAVVSIPQGSTLASSTDGGPPQRKNSVRGVMIFRQHDYFYLVSDQELPAIDARTPPISPQERIEMRRDELQKVIAGMTFQ